MVFMASKDNGFSLSEYIIIDGQQRLTTMMLFLKALCDLAEKHAPEIAEEIKEDFLHIQNQLQNETGLHFIDSTPISTCLNRRIFSHKVTKEFASRGKSTKGWFYGFKLHGVCSEKVF